MNKLVIFVLPLFLFIVPCSMADELSQSDFYGTWRYTSQTETLTLIFTESVWTANINGETLNVEILRWEPVDNNNINTFQLFPNGFRITIRQLSGNVESTFVYIDREKRRIIMPEFSRDAVITKQ